MIVKTEKSRYPPLAPYLCEKKMMRKFLFSVFVIACCFVTVSWSANENQDIPIYVLDHTAETKGQRHRAPVYIPMYAYYSGSSSSVFLHFLQNLGEVTVMFSCLSVGNYVEYNIDSSLDFAEFPVMDRGTVCITILLSDGRRYEGNFVK